MNSKKESSSFSQFIGQWNGSLQMGLLVAAPINFVFGMTLPAPFNLIVAIGGCLLIAIASVLSASISMRQTIIKQNQEAQLKEFVQTDDKAQVLSLPPMRVLVIRNTITLLLFVLALGVLWGSYFGAIAFMGRIESGRMSLISAGVMIGGAIGAIYGSFAALTTLSVVVDRYIYRHEAIWQTFYKEDANKDGKAILFGCLKTFGRIFGSVLIITPLMLLSAWIKSDNFNLDLPVYGYVLCIGAMAILPFAGLWWMYRSLFSHRKIEDAIVKTYGTDSEQAREYKKEITQQSNSIEQQVMRNMMKWLFGSIAGFFVVVIVLRFVLITLPITGEQAQVVMTVALCLFMIGIFLFFTRGTGLITKGIQHPEEYQKIDDAIKQGDYAAAQQYAEIVREKKPPVEANFVIAWAYGVGGKFDSAEQACREALKLLLIH
jgi:hypothetical protein